MGLDRRQLRTASGLRFAKLLGTGDGHTFTLRDADPRHWALLAVWDDVAAAHRFAAGTMHRGWQRLCQERLEVLMTPLASRGRWAGQEPFGPIGANSTSAGPTSLGPTSADPTSADPTSADPTRNCAGQPSGGPVAAITRARLRPLRARSFWRAVPPVSADLAAVDGLGLAIGIGEAPIGLQGTFSLWQSARALNEFAYRRPAHTDVVARTVAERWYAEELFARFAVRSVTGTFAGRLPLIIPRESG